MRPTVSQRELGGKLAGLSLRKQVWVLAVWPLAEQFMNFLVGTVDLALAGRLEPEAEAVFAADALGLAGFVGWLMALIHSSVGVGAGALIGRAIGGRRIAAANAALGQSMIMAIGVGCCVGALLFTSAPWISAASGLDGRSFDLSTQYLRIVALAAPPSALLLVGNAALRAAGDTRTPFFVMIFINLINIAVSVALVFGPEPIGGRGVAGIAMGTAIAWTCGAAAVMFVVVRGAGELRLLAKRIKPHMHTLRRILRVSLPNLLETTIGIWLGNFIVLRIVSELNQPGAVGAHMIAIRIESASFLCAVALGMAAATLMAQYLGLGDPVRARRAAMAAWQFSLLIMSAFGVLFFLKPEPFVRLITDAPALVENAIVPIQIAAVLQPFFATQIVFSSALRGAGDTRAMLWISAFSTFLVRVPLCYLIGVHLGYGLNGIWIGLSLEMCVRSTLTTLRFRSGKWKSAAV